MNPYEQGNAEAFAALGLEKTARGAILKPVLSGAWKFLKSMKPTWKGTKEMFIGNPKQLWQEARAGTALSKGSLIRQSLNPKGVLNKALWYGFPAYEGYEIATDDQGDKWKRLGAAAGGAALGIAAFKPLGMLGAMALDPIGRMAGKGFGGGAEALKNKIVPPQGNPMLNPATRPAGYSQPRFAPVARTPQMTAPKQMWRT
jgi:hypothetical protein